MIFDVIIVVWIKCYLNYENCCPFYKVSSITDSDGEKVVLMLGRCLPYIVPNVILAKREVSQSENIFLLLKPKKSCDSCYIAKKYYGWENIFINFINRAKLFWSCQIKTSYNQK